MGRNPSSMYVTRDLSSRIFIVNVPVVIVVVTEICSIIRVPNPDKE